MRALIVSDSHGLEKELADLRKEYEGKVDAMFHCGDSELEFENEVLEGYEIVEGNCDYYETRFPAEIVKDVEGIRFFVTHGHLHGIKRSLGIVAMKADEVGAKIVCFGHSHIRGAELVDGVLFVNPGSILQPRKYREESYAIIEYGDKEITVQFFDLSHKEVDKAVFKK